MYCCLPCPERRWAGARAGSGEQPDLGLRGRAPGGAWRQAAVGDVPGLILGVGAEIPISVLGLLFEASVGSLQYGENNSLFWGLAALQSPLPSTCLWQKAGFGS